VGTDRERAELGHRRCPDSERHSWPLASGRSCRALCPGACRRLPWPSQGLLRRAPFCRASFWKRASGRPTLGWRQFR